MADTDDVEQQLARLQQIEDLKPRKGAILLVIPILSVIAVGILYVGMFTLGIQGRAADGDRRTFAWSTCAEAQPVVEARVAAMGLGEPEATFADGILRLTTTLPAEADVAARIPQTLAMPGVITGTAESDPARTVITNADITAAAMRQDLTLMPWTVLTLTEAAQERLRAFVLEERDGKVVYRLDGQTIGTVSNLKGAPREVELTPEGTDDRDRMHKAAERSVVLGSGPLPCPLTPVTP
jgi:hypothetical protein